eukprot:CAMPEP_0202857492 /NCGR_PEP_ID=MMETSP1391-20130828/409_1 /ASSEMBLY_ACC=CAM_ASM_000867 /TAXON_ID=1034604 /ORGANISM="Chlamydomonas leiostraca, Strain SAG 11-49" /LENGTH=669 /DNA_ID=CAMNT_0049536297 /DNA_START=214 /DNA_END=2223 /DNA_ORIENTATION=-
MDPFKKMGGSLRWTPDDALELTGFSRMQWLVFVGAGLAWAADACSVMLLSFVGPAARCEWQLDPWQESLLGSALFAGQLVGASPWGAYGDAFGRRSAMLWSCVLTAVFGFASALAPSYWWLVAARTGAGFALSALPICFTLMLEWTPPRLRGRVMMLFNVWWTGGTIVEACLAWLLLNHMGWRLLVTVSAVPQLLVILMYPWLPESPTWLLAQAAAARAAADSSGMFDETPAKRVLHAKAAKYESAAADVLQKAAGMAGVQLPAGVVLVAAGTACEDGDEGGGPPHSDEEHGDSSTCTSSCSSAGLGDGGLASLTASGDVSPSTTTTSNGRQRRHAVSRTAAADQEPLLSHTPAGKSSGYGKRKHRHGKPSHPLLHPAMVTLMFVWFVAALAYYGVVMLAAQLRMAHGGSTAVDAGGTDEGSVLAAGLMEAAASAAGEVAAEAPHEEYLDQSTGWDTAASRDILYYHEEHREVHRASQHPLSGAPSMGATDCVGGRVQLPSSTFTAVITAATSEIPAMFLSTMVVGAGVNHAHRAAAVSLTLAGTAAALLMDVGLRAHGPLAGGWASWLDTVALLASRCLVCAAFNLLYLYTPELLSPKVRALGMGVCNTISRLGGLAAPMLAVGMVERGEEKLSIATLGVLCAAAGTVLWVLPPHSTLVAHSHADHGM